MPEADLVAKMLRAVLQSNKNGIPLPRLQGEYKSLTGDWIPFKQLGHSTLEGYLKTVPGVVKIEINKMGEMTCHAVACAETVRIAQLVARQRSSKRKMGRQVNCQMRLKNTAPFTLVGKPKATLRQPGLRATPEGSRRPTPPLPKSKGSFYGIVKPSIETAHYGLLPAPGSGLSKEVLMQRHVTMINRPEKRLTLPPRFQKELQVHLSRSSSVDSSDKLHKPLAEIHSIPPGPADTKLNEVQNRVKEVLNKYSNGIWLSKMPQFYREMYEEELNTALLPQFEYWPHICTVEKVCTGGHTDVLLYPAKKMQQLVKSGIDHERTSQNLTSSKADPLLKPATETKSALLNKDFKQKVAEILLKYSNGLWANALPKVYEDTYKVKFPEDALNNLDLLSDVCTVNQISDSPKKAILYAKPQKCIDENLNTTHSIRIHEDLKLRVEQESSQLIEKTKEQSPEETMVPPLIIPAEASPSVLVVELDNTNEVVIRYVGKDYSAAQELMEDEMKDYYSQNPTALLMQSVSIGQLVAVYAEEDAWLRAQIISMEDNRIKVCYVDYGFSEIIENNKVYKLGRHFYSLPFQAAKCKLAGLEVFCDDPVLVKVVESQTCGKIFAVEMLEKSDIPLVVLYDTSGEDDININVACLKALCDKSLELRLQADALYANVRVTNVCSDGTLYCQVPSKGLAKLCEILQKLEDYFHYKQASEYYISLPFCGKICLFHCKGKWARVEITSVHSSRALDVQFMDTGTVASVKVSELREIPSQFLREIITVPPQATKCCLADLPLNIGMWTPDAVLWLRDTVLNCPDCSIKVVKLDDSKGIAHIYLFTPKNFPDPDRSINRQITSADLWKHQKDVFLSVAPCGASPTKERSDAILSPELIGLGLKKSPQGSVKPTAEPSSGVPTVDMPPLLPLPKPGEHMDVYVSVACHPGHFVIQPWQEIHNLEVLMEEMILYYSMAEERPIAVKKNNLYAAKVENKWHRVVVKGILTNGLVSVYELDYGKHELVSIRKVQPLMDMFRKLPFQAITAQLAGVKCEQWSEDASIVFRNHVEKKPLVALVQAVNESTNSWDRKIVTYLVDTSLPETDIWIHDFMSQYFVELSKVN
ncbi:tudor domain-containing protein 7 isoform X1 [Pelodiscus sinensis]|uniref:Tudor domain-containing protein 7 n=3 Tax=Pelodiscus sinensis TaxID=13735 RepID=K7FAR6_PELSI|nr:tudor domain-containing protein 7 isoform X3 [Pelodiscus sinensis]|eukprot:XP_006111781.1 tudor domain-containing protein 7 isoform X3 [Pelodiscus sinensis]